MASGPPADRRSACAALSALYRIASLALRQRGEFARSRVAIDRALTAAEQAGDGLLLASVAATLTVQLMMQGDPEAGVSLALDAARQLQHEPDLDTTAGRVVDGALHLYAAQAAARARDHSHAAHLLHAATRIADELARDQEEYFLFFGPTNVAIQRAAIHVDLGRPVEAINSARAVLPDRIPSVSRAGYHHLHLARAHDMRGDDDAAAVALVSAHRAAPEIVQHDPLSHDLVRHLLARRRRVDESVRRIARDMQLSG